MPYVDQYTLSGDPVFLTRVEMAMLDYCNDVQKEAETVNGHNLRKAAAAKAMGDPIGNARLVAKVICGSIPTLTANVTDPQLKQAISNTWDLLSGV
jgi:hypothetical protein